MIGIVFDSSNVIFFKLLTQFLEAFAHRKSVALMVIMIATGCHSLKIVLNTFTILIQRARIWFRNASRDQIVLRGSIFRRKFYKKQVFLSVSWMPELQFSQLLSIILYERPRTSIQSSFTIRAKLCQPIGEISFIINQNTHTHIHKDT